MSVSVFTTSCPQVRSASPDQFFIMTYVAQFYHKFSIPDSGYDSTSGLTTSFKYSSSEEDNTGSLGLRHKVTTSAELATLMSVFRRDQKM